MKEENENGFTLEDQSDLYEYMEDLADRLPKERKARQELNQFDKEQLVLFEALFPKEYIFVAMEISADSFISSVSIT